MVGNLKTLQIALLVASSNQHEKKIEFPIIAFMNE